MGLGVMRMTEIHPTCFMSYSWDSEAHKQWVIQLAVLLANNGVRVHLDEWEVLLGQDLTEFMEAGIRESDYVLIVCTPTYARKANKRKGGAGYETSVITGELFQVYHRPRKYIPLLRFGDPEVAIPSYLKSCRFLDFREEVKFDQRFEELLKHIYKQPTYPSPTLGPKPSFVPQHIRTDQDGTTNLGENLPATNLDNLIQHKQKELEELYKRHVPNWITGGLFMNRILDNTIAVLSAELSALQSERKRRIDSIKTDIVDNPSACSKNIVLPDSIDCVYCLDGIAIHIATPKEEMAKGIERYKCTTCGISNRYSIKDGKVL